MFGQDSLLKYLKISLITVFVMTQVSAQEFVSPIHSTNQHVNQLMFYRPYTHSSQIKKLDSLNFDLSQSNIFQKSENIEADFEITTLELTYYYPLSNSLEFSFNYPLYYISSGFLDNSLEFVHTTLNIETTRENEGHKNNQLLYKLTDRVEKTNSYFASGNPQLELKHLLYKNETFLISGNVGVKIPLGSKEDGFTNEKLAFMSGLQVQKNYENISWIANFVVTFDEESRLSKDIVSQKFRYFFYLTNKFKIMNKTNLLLAYQYSSSPYKSSDVKFSSHTHLFQFALRRRLADKSYIDLYLNQNTIPRHNEADITIGLSYHFSGIIL